VTRLRAARRDRLLTQVQLARRAKLSIRTICAIEVGKPCRLDTKRKLLAALGIPFERWRELWPGEDHR